MTPTGGAAPGDAATPVDVVVVTAMADESTPFIKRADAATDPERVAHAVHRHLSVAGLNVLLVQCGVGLVNSAAATTVAISSVSPRAVISAGSAGGLGAEVRVGDVVVGSRYLYSGADARAFGYALGQVPGMPADYEADPSLLGAAQGADPDWAADAAGLADAAPLHLLTGTVLSGDTFVDAPMVPGLRESFPDALSTDMESTALAHVCHLYGVPFVSVRGISDLCGPSAGSDFATHVDDAADRSAAVVVAVLHALAARS